MNKEDIISFLKQDHEKLKNVTMFYPYKILTSKEVIENWTVKDILAHIAAWNWEETKAIELLLKDKRPWYIGKSEDIFNEKAIKERKRKSYDEVYREWENSFKKLIKNIAKLSGEEWLHKTPFVWEDGSPLTIASLFYYTYKGFGHEGGHAKQIKNKLEILLKYKNS